MLTPAMLGEWVVDARRRTFELVADLDDPGWDAYLRAQGHEFSDLVAGASAERAVHALAGMLLEREELVITADIEAAKILIRLHP